LWWKGSTGRFGSRQARVDPPTCGRLLSVKAIFLF
jgi:hypothetical protein